MSKNTTTLLLIGGAAAAFFWFSRGRGAPGVDSLSDSARIALQVEQEKTKQQQQQLEYLKAQGEQTWEDVFKSGVGGLFGGLGQAVPGLMSGIKL